MPENGITAVVLAAGKGTRMKSNRAKMLHQVFFRPMLSHVLDAAEVAAERVAVVVGHQRDEVAALLENRQAELVVQEEQLGTGHAVLCARQACAASDTVMILCGDTPLIRAEILEAMIAAHRAGGVVCTVMTTVVDEPFGYGRAIIDEQGWLLAIVEQKDASEEERLIREINAGIYCVNREFLFSALEEVGTDNSQGEVYLTDVVAVAKGRGLGVSRFVHHAPIDVLGVNSRVELAQAHEILRMRRNRELMLAGVTMYSPETITVAPGAEIGADTVIHAGVQIWNGVRIGTGCVIEPGSQLSGCTLGDDVYVGALSVLYGCELPEGSDIEPGCVMVE